MIISLLANIKVVVILRNINFEHIKGESENRSKLKAYLLEEENRL
jgi:hypothetical protein